MAAMDEEYEEDGWINRNNQPVAAGAGVAGIVGGGGGGAEEEVRNLDIVFLRGILLTIFGNFRPTVTTSRWRTRRRCWGNV